MRKHLLSIYSILGFLVLSVVISLFFSGKEIQAAFPENKPFSISISDEYSLNLPLIFHGSSWPTAAANPQRTGWIQESIRGQLKPIWYKVFEPYLLPRTQIIAVNGKLFIASARGLYALDARTGNELWVYPTELPLADTPTYYNGVVYIGGFDKQMHAIDANSGIQKWTFTAEAGFQVNPLVVNNTVYAGNRDGYFYAIDVKTGTLNWKYKTGGPIVYSAAFSDGVVYFASQDSHAYAIDESGELRWKSEKLPGGGFHSYWPVIFDDYVIFSGSLFHRPGGPTVQLSMENWFMAQKEDIWPDYRNLPIDTFAGPIVDGSFPWAHTFPVMDASRPNGSYSNAISEYLEDDGQVRFDRYTNKPWRRALFVLNKDTGVEVTYDFDQDGNPEYAPVTFFGTKGVNTRYPPIVGPDGILYLQMVYKSAPGIAGGGLVGWKVDTPYFSLPSYDKWDAPQDEPHYNSGGGSLVYTNRCCDRIGRSIDLLESGNSWTYFAYDLEQDIPDFQEKYFIPPPTPPHNHLYMPYASFGRNGSYGRHGDGAPPIPYRGLVYMIHGNSVIAFGNPEGEAVKLPEAKIIPVTKDVPGPSKFELTKLLEAELQKIVQAGHLRPGYINSGLVDSEHYECGDELEDYWHHPSETIYFLLRALPHVPSPALREELRAYIQDEFTKYPPYEINHIGWKDGANRQIFDFPPEVEAAMQKILPSQKSRDKVEGWSFNPFTFYALYLYAEEFGNAKQVFDTATSQSILMEAFDSVPPDSYLIQFPHVHNAYISGYIGYLELERLGGYPQSPATKAILDRLLLLRASSFSTDHNWNTAEQGVYCRAYLASRNFLYMVPELAIYLRQNALSKVEAAVSEYDYLTPYWFVSKAEVEFGEGVIKNIYDTHGLFQARAKILNNPYQVLLKFLDVPAFEVGDLFYLEKLTSALEAEGDVPARKTPGSRGR